VLFDRDVAIYLEDQRPLRADLSHEHRRRPGIERRLQLKVELAQLLLGVEIWWQKSSGHYRVAPL